MESNHIVFGLEESQEQAADFAAENSAELGSVNFSQFDDGETQILVDQPEAIAKKSVTLVGALNEERHFLEMMSLIYAMRHQFRASSVAFDLPEIGFAPIRSFDGRNVQEVNQASAYFQALKLMGVQDLSTSEANRLPLGQLFPKPEIKLPTPTEKLVFGLEHCQDLAQALADPSSQHDYAELSFDRDGRMYVPEPQALANRDILLMASLEKDDHFMQAMALIESFRNQFRANSVELVVPYLGYSTMERMSKVPGEVARGIPHVQGLYGMGPKRINFLDLHEENFLNCGGPEGIGEHMVSQELVVDMIHEIQQEKGEVVLVSPDLGRASWVRTIARAAGDLPHDTLTKVRSKTVKDKTEVSGGDRELIQGKTCIIFDDMVRTGGSAIKAAERLLELGAKEVIMITTHMVLPKSDRVDAEARIHNSAISRLYGTDSHSRSKSLSSPKMQVRTVAGLIEKHVRSPFRT